MKPERKKLKNQETKKKQHNTKKQKKIAHPKGGSSGRELGLVIFFRLFGILFFWFLVFFGFWCFLALQKKPTTDQKIRNQNKQETKKKYCTPQGGE